MKRRIFMAIGVVLLLVGAIFAYRGLYVPWRHLCEAQKIIRSENQDVILKQRRVLRVNKWRDLGPFKDTFFNDICGNLERTKDYGALDAQFMILTDYLYLAGADGGAIPQRQKDQIRQAVARYNKGEPLGLKWKMNEHKGKYTMFCYTIPTEY